MKERHKTIIFLGDGMADEPIPALAGKTPLQHARTPAMDSIAARGASGTVFTLPQGFPSSSDVANMSVLGCDLETEFCGRGVLEAVARGIPLGSEDIAFRCSLVSVKDGFLADSAGGHISQHDAETAIAALNAELGSDTVRFHTGVSYRNLLVLSGKRHSTGVTCEKPDDHNGSEVAYHPPRPLFTPHIGWAESERRKWTVKVLCQIIADSERILTPLGLPANAVWPWSPGRAGTFTPLAEKYGITAAAVSAVDVIKGLGISLGMDVITVPGATGYIDTNYEGKADAAIEAIKTHDLVFVHVEAIDEVSHSCDLQMKIKAIEDFDSRLISRVMSACGDNIRYVVLPDHPVPVATGKHTREPVPVSVCGPAVTPDTVQTYDETAALSGSIGALHGPDFMSLLWIRRNV